jgi:hypothetical protein
MRELRPLTPEHIPVVPRCRSALLRRFAALSPSPSSSSTLCSSPPRRGLRQQPIPQRCRTSSPAVRRGSVRDETEPAVTTTPRQLEGGGRERTTARGTSTPCPRATEATTPTRRGLARPRSATLTRILRAKAPLPIICAPDATSLHLKRALRSASTTTFNSAAKARVRMATTIATSALHPVRAGRIASIWQHPEKQRVLPAATAPPHCRRHPRQTPAAAPGMQCQ